MISSGTGIPLEVDTCIILYKKPGDWDLVAFGSM
jgi:hypothetical protein